MIGFGANLILFAVLLAWVASLLTVAIWLAVTA